MRALAKRTWHRFGPAIALVCMLVVPAAAGAQMSAQYLLLASNDSNPAQPTERGSMTTASTSGSTTVVGNPARSSTAPAEMSPFERRQLRYPRVRGAAERTGEAVREMFEAADLPFPPTNVFLRTFKYERAIELWAMHPENGRYHRLKTYAVCKLSGTLGPKRRRGDLQVPEGFYSIDLFNPVSSYHLSMRINYPNRSDRAHRRSGNLGGDIYIHGGCATVGCLPMTDEAIEELYWIAVQARANGQREIPIHVYPARMDGPGMARLWRRTQSDFELWSFWLNMKAGYDYFETHRRLPTITVDDSGAYRFGT